MSFLEVMLLMKSEIELCPDSQKCNANFNYNKLWKLLIDKKMNKQDLRKLTGISTASIAKLGKGDNITTDVLMKICLALDCDISDIVEIEKADEINA